MASLVSTPHYWQEALDYLQAHDPKLAAIIATHPTSILTTRMDAFHTLMRSITGQQISVQAADAIWRRLEAQTTEITPNSCAIITEEQWRACGYSRQKIAYIGNLINFAKAGALNLAQINLMNDIELITHISSMKGIGKWSAEMFAIFCLMRPDILPLDDIGLQRAMAQQYGIPAKPFNKAIATEIAQNWQPYRSVATWFLWRSIDPNEVHY